MTKYIVEGGSYSRHPEKARTFFKEALAGLGESPTVLWCFFATEPVQRAERFQVYTEKAKAFYPDGVEPVCIEATEEDFESQVKEADLINIQGGSTLMLKAALEPFDLPALFADKVVAGHSAGMNILASSFWSPGLREFGEGFSILPIRTLTHYGSAFGSDDPRGPIDWDKAEAELEAYGNPDHEVLALEEGEFVVFEK